MQLTSG